MVFPKYLIEETKEMFPNRQELHEAMDNNDFDNVVFKIKPKTSEEHSLAMEWNIFGLENDLFSVKIRDRLTAAIEAIPDDLIRSEEA